VATASEVTMGKLTNAFEDRAGTTVDLRKPLVMGGYSVFRGRGAIINAIRTRSKRRESNDLVCSRLTFGSS
jgi:hypothetical protein